MIYRGFKHHEGIELMMRGDDPSLREVVDKLDKHVSLATQNRQSVRLYSGSLDGVPSLFRREDMSCMASTCSTTMTTDPADPETRSSLLSQSTSSQNPCVRGVCSCGPRAFGLLSLVCAGATAVAARQSGLHVLLSGLQGPKEVQHLKI